MQKPARRYPICTIHGQTIFSQVFDPKASFQRCYMVV
jgi:hypothetical protein